MIDVPRAVVTGAPGWLGTRLVEALVGGEGAWPAVRARRVRCLVQPGVDASYLRSLGAETVEADLTGPAEHAAALRGAEIVFHLAGLIHPRRISELYALNAHGTRRLVDAAARAGCRRFVFVSSNSPAGVNPDAETPLDETALNPYMNYGRSKRIAEEAVLAANAAARLEGVVLRPCWFYGPGQPARQTRFFRMIAGGRPLVFGTGLYRRSMSYVDNTVQGLILAAAASGAPGQIYWIADERPYSIEEIYSVVAGLLGVQDFRPRRVPEVLGRLSGRLDACLQAAGLYVPELHVAGELVENIFCSVDKAKRELGYVPRVSLEEGMRRSIEWCRRRGIL